jgi:hypothetical protein
LNIDLVSDPLVNHTGGIGLINTDVIPGSDEDRGISVLGVPEKEQDDSFLYE